MNEWQQRKTKRNKICVINFDQNNFLRSVLTQKNKILNSPSIWQGNFCKNQMHENENFNGCRYFFSS
jgi:hypothetical protein